MGSQSDILFHSRCTKDPRWLNNVFLFSTEIWAEQFKNHPVRVSPGPMQWRLPPCKKHHHTFVHNTHCSISLLKIFQQSIFNICNNTSCSTYKCIQLKTLSTFLINIQLNTSNTSSHILFMSGLPSFLVCGQILRMKFFSSLGSSLSCSYNQKGEIFVN